MKKLSLLALMTLSISSFGFQASQLQGVFEGTIVNSDECIEAVELVAVDSQNETQRLEIRDAQTGDFLIAIEDQFLRDSAKVVENSGNLFEQIIGRSSAYIYSSKVSKSSLDYKVEKRQGRGKKKLQSFVSMNFDAGMGASLMVSDEGLACSYKVEAIK